MSRYILIRRLRGPVFLLLVGILALLHQANVIDHFWRLFWPLLLIMLGVFKLAERAALANEMGYGQGPYPDGGYGNAPYPNAPYGNAPYAGAPYPGGQASAPSYPMPTSTAIVPAHTTYLTKDPNGGNS